MKKQLSQYLSTRFTPTLLSIVMAAALPGYALADIKIGFTVPLTGFAAADGKSAH